MVNTFEDLGRTFEAMAKNTEDKAQELKAKTAKHIYEHIILVCRVDTGRYRASNIIKNGSGLASISLTDEALGIKEGSKSVPVPEYVKTFNKASLEGARAGVPLIIINEVPYAKTLEEAYSTYLHSITSISRIVRL